MNSTQMAEEFDDLWRESESRAGQNPDWSEMTLLEQQQASSRFRKEMGQYGNEDPTAENRMGSGLYGSPTSSRSPGSNPG